ncbi:MAG: hypothetical protein V4501_08160 [Pseudomonadota bacterium]
MEKFDSTAERGAVAAMTAETVGVDLLSALVAEVKLLPDVWEKLPQLKQEDLIERLRNRVAENVKQAVHLISSANRITVSATLDSITISGGTKATLKIDMHNDPSSLQELFGSVKKPCLIIVAPPADHMGDMKEVKGDPNQPDIFEANYHVTDESDSSDET